MSRPHLAQVINVPHTPLKQIFRILEERNGTSKRSEDQ